MVLPTEDRYLQSKTEFEDDIAALLGGYVAERLTSATPRPARATTSRRRPTGPADGHQVRHERQARSAPVRAADELVFLGREIGEQRNYSDEVAKTIDEEVRAIIDKAYERATEVLTTHREKLIALAEKLVAEETVDSDGFEALFSDVPPKEDLHGIPTIIGPGQPVAEPNPQPA